MVLDFADFGPLKVAPFIPLLPLLGAVLVAILGPRILKSASHWPVILGLAGAVVCSGLLFGAVRQLSPDQFSTIYQIYSWISPEPGISFDVNFHIVPLPAVMLLTVCIVSLLVAIYSRDYMREHDQTE